MTRNSSRAVAATLLMTLMCVASSFAADPHYTNLKRVGATEYASGEYAAAAKTLRLACFGLLEDPQLLADCLARLALAESASGDQTGARATIQRLESVEGKFGTYSDTSFSQELRDQLERALPGFLSQEALAISPVFSHVAEAQTAIEFSSLSPRQRRREAEKRAAADPANPTWQIELANLDMNKGKTKSALQRLDSFLEDHPGSPAVRCLRDRFLLMTKRCAPLDDDLVSCEEITTRADLSADHLRCLMENSPERAGAYLAALGETVRSHPSITEIASDIPATPPVATDADLPPVEEAPIGPPTSPRNGTPGDPAVGDPLETPRRLAADARTREALTAALVAAKSVADADPLSAEAQFLVAEIAYRASLWEDTVEYFRRGGDPGDERSLLLFYQAVAHYQIGDLETARSLLQRCIEQISRTPYVEKMAKEILGESN